MSLAPGRTEPAHSENFALNASKLPKVESMAAPSSPEGTRLSLLALRPCLLARARGSARASTKASGACNVPEEAVVLVTAGVVGKAAAEGLCITRASAVAYVSQCVLASCAPQVLDGTAYQGSSPGPPGARARRGPRPRHGQRRACQPGTRWSWRCTPAHGPAMQHQQRTHKSGRARVSVGMAGSHTTLATAKHGASNTP